MITKHYSSGSHIAVSVILKSGKSTHVSFTPLSNGHSVYATSSEEMQEALEKHWRFGDLFVLSHVEDDSEAKKTEDNEAVQEEVAEDGLRKVKVSDLGEAKNYLAETFGISRTSLRSQKTIVETAKENGVEFEGI